MQVNVSLLHENVNTIHFSHLDDAFLFDITYHKTRKGNLTDKRLTSKNREELFTHYMW